MSRPTSHLSPGANRRDFLKWSGLAAAGAWTASRFPVMAGPFAHSDWDQYIPADKKLRSEWVRSLFERGEPTVYTKSRNELRYIGMPVGGLCCGTLYLSGDGRLWYWDIFNQNREGVLDAVASWQDVGFSFAGSEQDLSRKIRVRDGANFVKPRTISDSPAIAQGFALRTRTPRGVEVRKLDGSDWAEVRFSAQYPVATVTYQDPATTMQVRTEAFSPFIPLNAKDSSLPVTILSIAVTNRGSVPVETELAGWLQNATCFHSAKPNSGTRFNRVIQDPTLTTIAMEFQPRRSDPATRRPDVLVEDFEKGYEFWTAEGEAFGHGPVSRAVVPPYQGDLGGEGSRIVNSHASAPGDDIAAKDRCTGRLRSKPFRIQRKYLAFYIGGGKDSSQVGMRLWIAGKAVATASGQNQNRMRLASFDTASFEGQEATLEIYDQGKAGWGNIGVDQIVQTDEVRSEIPLERRADFGTMALALLGESAMAQAGADHLPAEAFKDGNQTRSADPVNSLIGCLAVAIKLAPGETRIVRFLVCWHFPNNPLPVPDAGQGNYYARPFENATGVARYVAANYERLAGDTRSWVQTWQNSTLPHWFLERTFMNISTLATTTAHRFASGRFWAWEGVGCCEGTCTHVWHYAQAVGRLFPEIERDQRERVDFGVGFDEKHGLIRHRAEGTGPAIDGQCGRVLGVWREHLMSADDGFLRRLWPRVKLAAQHILDHDQNGDGLIDGAQENTLDAAWFGKIAWISSLALAALRASELMAERMGDRLFASQCRDRWQKGKAAMQQELWNGEYFIQLPEPGKEKNLGTYEGCHIDQVLGQSWAWQIGLGRILDRDKTVAALRSLWTYNFSPDVGVFRSRQREGRPYAMAGDAGLVMSTNPQLKPNAFGGAAWQSGYFNECMSGFEHQAASHMIAEGLVQEGLAVTRAIHDRYHAARRNPFNEIECSDHYSRAMASYGSFIAMCGFEHDGPARHLGFAPRLKPENFRAAFVAGTGWGIFAQQRDPQALACQVEVKWGTISLRTLSLEMPKKGILSAQVHLEGSLKPSSLESRASHVLITLEEPITLSSGQSLRVVVA